MRKIVLIQPGPLESATGGYAFNRQMVNGLRGLGWDVDVREVDGSFPHPTSSALTHAAAALAEVPDAACVLVDGLALGAMADVIEHEAVRLRIAALMHLPLGADVSLEPRAAHRLAIGERRAIAAVSLVVVTGTAALEMLSPYGIAHEKVVVVEPGTERAPIARGSDGGTVHLLSVGTLNAIKGHEILLEALAAVPERNWHLTCAGSLTRDAATAGRVRTAIGRLTLDDRLTLTGELDAARVGECYDRADVFVLATRQETFGMAVAEALARGLPVVATKTGAIPALVGADAGLLVPAGDVDGLAHALSRVIRDQQLRARLAAGARRVRERLRTWPRAVEEMSAALGRLFNDE